MDWRARERARVWSQVWSCWVLDLTALGLGGQVEAWEGWGGGKVKTYFEGLEVLDLLAAVAGQVIRECERDLWVLERDGRHADATARVEAAG